MRPHARTCKRQSEEYVVSNERACQRENDISEAGDTRTRSKCAGDWGYGC